MGNASHIPEPPKDQRAADVECPSCGASGVSVRTELQRFRYGPGESAPELECEIPVMRCGECGEEFTDHRAEAARHEAVCRHLGMLTPTAIREIRVRTRKSRRQFAEIVGFGVASLGRWERGSHVQSAATDRFLRLLAYDENFVRLDRLAAGVDLSPPDGTSVPSFQVLKVDSALREEQCSFRLAVVL